MQVPIEITFTSTKASDAVKELVEQEAAKLDRVCDHIGSCRVAIEKQARPIRSGNPYRVRVELHVPPRHTLVAIREPNDSGMHDPLPVVIKGTFHSARTQLRKLVEKQQGHVKLHQDQVMGAVISRLFPDEGYGFIKTPEGRDIYFHQNSVLHHDFDRLEIGTLVRFEEEQGEDGPQASTVQVVDKPGARVTGDEEVPPPLGWEQQ
jgi:cold shock CspA family protein/ribosome-associated translation inhibitor RaiA